MLVDGRVLARLVKPNLQVDMQDVSFGGFGLTSSVPVTPGDVHSLKVITANGSNHMLMARVVYCRPPTNMEPRYVSGWQIEADTDSKNALAAILDTLTAQLHFSTD